MRNTGEDLEHWFHPDAATRRVFSAKLTIGLLRDFLESDLTRSRGPQRYQFLIESLAMQLQPGTFFEGSPIEAPDLQREERVIIREGGPYTGLRSARV